jgi:predicted glutamine amidotransferase
MCRMVGFAFRAGGIPVVRKVLTAFVDASRDDIYLKGIAGDGRHCHGYGYVAVLKRHGAWVVLHERFDAVPAMSGEEACEANLEALSHTVKRFLDGVDGFTEGVVVFHSRRTRGEPRGFAAAHPFREELLINTVDGPEIAELYLCHNGGVLKESIAQELGLPNTSLYTDSHIFLKLLTHRAEGVLYNDFPKVLEETITEAVRKNYVKSALDILVLLNSPTMGPMLLAGAYVVEKDSSAKWKYYEPVLFETQHAKGYVSSTIRENLRKMSENVNFIDGRDGYVAILKSESLETKQLTLARD